jgi:large subunit ribosomal protein L23
MILNVYDLIKNYLVTEKSNDLQKQNKYSFIVNKLANKTTVKKAVEQVFQTKVIKVNIINSKATSRVFKGVKGKVSGSKKAVVTLAEGYEIKDLGGV